MPSPVIDAVSVSARDLATAAQFYGLLGFDFPDITPDMKHLEAETTPGATRLMIDTHALMEELTGEVPRPSNHAAFALLCDGPAAVDAIADRVAAAGFVVVTPPWDAFWGQRYATLADPGGYRVDLFAPLDAA